MSSIGKALKGKALDWFNNPNKEGLSWDEFKSAFLIKFTKEKNIQPPVIKFSDLVQRDVESVTEFYHRIVEAFVELEKPLPNGSFELLKPIYPTALTKDENFAKVNGKNKRNAARR